MAAQTKGLLNMPGQNNCFLNSAVQVLWHLDIFRRSFRELSGHACMGHDSCIFCALKELFMQFQYSQETALPPDSLRRALAETFSNQRRFQLGFMDDAAECFENMLLRLHYHLAQNESEDNCTAPYCISHQKFSMNLEERIICSTCNATSEPLPFTQLVHYVSTSALCHQSKKYSRNLINLSFGELLRSAGALGDVRDCPKSCGARVQIKKTLFNTPDIVSIGLVWDSERPNINQISDVFKIIGTALRLQDVFDQYNCPQGGMSNSGRQTSCILQLVGLVTYYGKHYSTFFYHTKLAAWIYFDDATVREIGPHWQQVIEKCIRGHFQPLLLLYANPNGSPVDTTNVPQDITAMINAPNEKKMSQAQSYYNENIKRNFLLLSRQNKTILQNNSHYDANYINGIATNQISNALINRYQRGRPGSVDDLLNNYASASEDVPDSPLTKSSTSSAYFSDIGEVDTLNFNQKMREKFMNQQKMTQKLSQKFQRSSSSSIDSFVEANARAMAKSYEESLPVKKLCSLQRRDSGNSSNGSGGSSGDRNSSSSGSSVTSENPYLYSIPPAAKRHLASVTLRQPISPNKDRNGHSDYGYDSYSLSSSDSFPVNGVPISPSKIQQMQQRKLSQIPEDVQYMTILNQSNLLDCDKLCSEADILLLKSHEKEREGEIKDAAMLSDSAAQKARSAMEAPYSNPQALITAKMKHSMCVMRSASLHRRIRETEAEEKRRLKAESLQIGHSRQGSRDSLHGKHSRQNSRDNLINLNDNKDNAIANNNNTNNSNNNNNNKCNKKESENETQHMKTMELYGTLPKKSTKKKLLNQTNLVGSSASLRIKDENKNKLIEIIKSSLSSTSSTITANQCQNLSLQASATVAQKKLRKQEKQTISKENKSDGESICSYNSSIRKLIPTKGIYNCKDSDFSDYYSEFEVRSASKIPVQKSLSGSISCRETESEYYAEVGEIQLKKQNRVRRKLIMGGFMKRKNRSLPDLRDGNDTVDSSAIPKLMDDSLTSKSVAQVSRKGFHALNGLTEKGIYQKASLLKVSPPLVEKISTQINTVKKSTISLTQVNSKPSIPYPATEITKPSVKYLSQTCKVNKDNITYTPPRTPPLPPHPLHDSQTTYSNEILAKRMSPSLGIEPCEELPPPPEDFLQDLREKRFEEINIQNKKEPEINDKISVSSVQAKKLNQKITENQTTTEAKPVYDTRQNLVKDLASKFEKLATSSVNNANVNTSNDQHSSAQYSSSQQLITNSPIKSENLNKEPLNPILSNSLHLNMKAIISTNLPQSHQSLTSNTSVHVHASNQIQSQMNNSLVKTTKNQDINSIPQLNNKQNKTTSSLRPATIYGAIKNIEQLKTISQSFIPPPSPSLSVSSSSSNYGCARPVRPPDYQTAMKRLGLMKAEMNSMMQNRFSNINNFEQQQQQQSISQQPQPTTVNQSQTSNNTPINQNTAVVNLGNTNYRSSLEDLIDSPNRNIIKRIGPKKSVSFSDQVVLVAPAEAEEEEHFPNPLLDRVLANSNILSMK